MLMDPVKRPVLKDASTEFYEVLFTGSDGEVFFFYKKESDNAD